MTTAFFWDERCFWHGGGDYAFLAPVGGLVQAIPGGLPENPETKRRLVNLLRRTGLWDVLATSGAAASTREDLLRVHPAAFLDRFEATSATGGGELGLRAPFRDDGYTVAALSAGLVSAAVRAVAEGRAANAYALSRPPGHHCLPEWQNGFCLLNNIGIAVKAARAAGVVQRVAVLDWDVHHGNGTEAIFYEDADVLTISLHQERNYPLDTGAFADRGAGAGEGANLNIPLPPGSGDRAWLAALERLALPAIRAHGPDLIVVACGFDASGVDPLSRTLVSSAGFRAMTRAVLDVADDVCGGRVAMAHEGGYSELHVPFCGHAVLDEMSGAGIDAPDPVAARLAGQQPGAAFNAFAEGLIGEMAEALQVPLW